MLRIAQIEMPSTRRIRPMRAISTLLTVAITQVLPMPTRKPMKELRMQIITRQARGTRLRFRIKRGLPRTKRILLNISRKRLMKQRLRLRRKRLTRMKCLAFCSVVLIRASITRISSQALRIPMVFLLSKSRRLLIVRQPTSRRRRKQRQPIPALITRMLLLIRSTILLTTRRKIMTIWLKTMFLPQTMPQRLRLSRTGTFITALLICLTRVTLIISQALLRMQMLFIVMETSTRQLTMRSPHYSIIAPRA